MNDVALNYMIIIAKIIIIAVILSDYVLPPNLGTFTWSNNYYTIRRRTSDLASRNPVRRLFVLSSGSGRRKSAPPRREFRVPSPRALRHRRVASSPPAPSSTILFSPKSPGSRGSLPCLTRPRLPLRQRGVSPTWIGGRSASGHHHISSRRQKCPNSSCDGDKRYFFYDVHVRGTTWTPWFGCWRSVPDSSPTTDDCTIRIDGGVDGDKAAWADDHTTMTMTTATVAVAVAATTSDVRPTAGDGWTRRYCQKLLLRD